MTATSVMASPDRYALYVIDNPDMCRAIPAATPRTSRVAYSSRPSRAARLSARIHRAALCGHFRRSPIDCVGASRRRLDTGAMTQALARQSGPVTAPATPASGPVTGGPDIILARHISPERLQECRAGNALNPVITRIFCEAARGSRDTLRGRFWRRIADALVAQFLAR